MIDTVTSGAGRPAEDSRSWATVPSARKWSRGAIVEIIIGASVWPKSCAMTGPILVSASSSRDGRHGRGAVPEALERGEIRGVERDVGQHHVDQGRGQERVGHAVPLDQLEEPADVGRCA